MNCQDSSLWSLSPALYFWWDTMLYYLIILSVRNMIDIGSSLLVFGTLYIVGSQIQYLICQNKADVLKYCKQWEIVK